jgi:hypothetical protein
VRALVIRTDRKFGYEFPFMDVSVCAAYTCAEDMSCAFGPMSATDRNMILGVGWLEMNVARVVRGTFQENVVVTDFGYRDLLNLKVLWLSLG